jgi:hypothetical protein
MAGQIPGDLLQVLESTDVPLTVAGVCTRKQFIAELYL